MLKRIALSLGAAAVLASAGLAQQPASIATLKTTAEASEFKSTSTYDEVVKFMKAVDAASPEVFYTTYGKTYEGREMPMAVVGAGLKDASPAAVRATNRLRVHIQGNIHAGEVEGKESAQILLREFGLGQHKEWLQSMVFLITPIFNADGNERFSLTNRQRQNGPINGMGTRQNAQGLNINRDFMKLETPEGRAFVKMWLDYDPQVGFDLHTSDGSCHGYFLTYSPPLNPNTSDAIMTLMKNEWFPSLTKSVKSKHDWNMFYYGNTSPSGCPVTGGRRGGDTPGGAAGAGRAGAGAPPAAAPQQPAAPAQAPAWATFEHVPRFHNNYVGMRNRFALLSEAYSYATFEDRIKATNFFMEEALAFAHANADRLKKVVAAVDKEPIVGKTLATRARITSGPMIEILMGDVEDEINPLNGAVMWRRKNVIKPTQMVDRLWFEPTATELVAAEYYVPATATKALELLRAHGVTMVQLKQPVTGLEQFTITSNTAAPVRTGSIDTGTHALRTLQGDWQAAAGVSAPAGAWVISMNQPLARLAFYLVAPTSDDGLTNWNFLDDLLTDAKTYPILRKR